MSLFWRLAKDRACGGASEANTKPDSGKGRRLLPFPHNPKQLTACIACNDWYQHLSQNTVSSVVGKDSPTEEAD